MPVLFNKEIAYLPTIQSAAGKYGIPVSLLMAHVKQESNFSPSAKLDEPALNDASYGITQILLSTAKGLDPGATVEKLYSPEYNLDLAAKLISQNMARYPGDIQSAIAAYNAGTARKNDQGQFVNSKGVANVQKYVDKVYQNYIDYAKWIENGENLIDVSINPWLVAGFSFVLVLTLIGGGIYASKKRKYHRVGAR